MKHLSKIVLGFVGFTVTSPVHASICEHIKFEERDPIPFVPFPLEHPSSGEKFLPNEEIELKSGKKMLAREFFRQLNDIESKLSRIGYSLRDEDLSNLGSVDECVDLLKKQGDLTKEGSSGPSDWNVENQLAQVKEKWERFKSELPDWETLKAKADDEAVQVYLPPVPKFSPPVPDFPRLESPEFDKSRTWSTEFGEKSKFWGSLSASLSIEASESQAKCDAQGAVRCAVLGKWEGEIVSASANASVFEDSAASLSVGVNLVGRSVYSNTWKQEGLKKKDKLEYTVDKGVNARFSLGPIPMKARVGFAGGVGLEYGFQVVPIQIGAFAVPFASTRAYAQVGVDIGIAGAGAGGDLILVEDYFTLKGLAGVSYLEELSLVLELSGTNELRALAGELYLFGFIDLWFKRWEGRISLWKWKGFTHSAEVFRFRTSWSPRGMTAEGDVQPEDLLQMEEFEEDASEVERVTALENKALARASAVFGALSEEMKSDGTTAMFVESAEIESIDQKLGSALSAYWDEVHDWVPPQ